MVDIIKQTFKRHEDKLIGRVMAEHCDARIHKVEKAINREEKYLYKLLRSRSVGSIMQGDVEGAFHRLRTALEPPKSAPKRKGRK